MESYRISPRILGLVHRVISAFEDIGLAQVVVDKDNPTDTDGATVQNFFVGSTSLLDSQQVGFCQTCANLFSDYLSLFSRFRSAKIA